MTSKLWKHYIMSENQVLHRSSNNVLFDNCRMKHNILIFYKKIFNSVTRRRAKGLLEGRTHRGNPNQRREKAGARKLFPKKFSRSFFQFSLEDTLPNVWFPVDFEPSLLFSNWNICFKRLYALSLSGNPNHEYIGLLKLFLEKKETK